MKDLFISVLGDDVYEIIKECFTTHLKEDEVCIIFISITSKEFSFSLFFFGLHFDFMIAIVIIYLAIYS